MKSWRHPEKSLHCYKSLKRLEPGSRVGKIGNEYFQKPNKFHPKLRNKFKTSYMCDDIRSIVVTIAGILRWDINSGVSI